MATMRIPGRRTTLISCFVIGWLLVFTYETLRHSHLQPLLKRELPKLPLLFPPAGWIMFYHVDKSYGLAEVYGIQDGTPTLIDPHEIFETKAIGYDNIRRNVLIGVLYRDRAAPFCRYLRRKFPAYETFAVVYAQYPDLINAPGQVVNQLAYQCSDESAPHAGGRAR
jgi:hypothetical protein